MNEIYAELCEATITIGNVTWSCSCDAGHTGPHMSQAPITHIVISGPEWTDEQAEMMAKVNDIVKFQMEADYSRKRERILEFLYEEFGMNRELSRLRGIFELSNLTEEARNSEIGKMIADSDEIANSDIPF